MDIFSLKLVEVSDKGWNVAFVDKNDCGSTVKVYLDSFENPKMLQKSQVKSFRTNTECLKGSEKIMCFANFMNFEKVIEIIENIKESINADTTEIAQNLRGFVYFSFHQMIALDYNIYRNYLLSFRKVMVELYNFFEKLYKDSSLSSILQECEPEVLEMMKMILGLDPLSTFFFDHFGNEIEGFNMQNTQYTFKEYMNFRYLQLINNNIGTWYSGGKSLRFALGLGIIIKITSQIMDNNEKRDIDQKLFYFLKHKIDNLNEEQSKFYNPNEISNLFLSLSYSLDMPFDINAEIIECHIRAIYFVKSIKSKIEIMQIVNDNLSKTNTNDCLSKMIIMNFHIIALQHQDLVKYLTEYFKHLVKANCNLREYIQNMIVYCHDPETLSKIIELIILVKKSLDYQSLIILESEFLKKWNPKFFQHFVELCQTIVIEQNDYTYVINQIYSSEIIKQIEKSILCVDIMSKNEMNDLRQDFIIKLLGDYMPNFLEDVLHKLLLISNIEELSRNENFIDNLINKISLTSNSLLIQCLYTKIEFFGPLIASKILLLYETVCNKPDCLKVFNNIIKKISYTNLAEELIIKIFNYFNKEVSEDNIDLFFNLFFLINKENIFYNGSISAVFRKVEDIKYEDLLYKMFFDKCFSAKYEKEFITLIILLNTKFCTSAQWTKDIMKGFLKKLIKWKNNEKVYKVIENLLEKDFLILMSDINVSEAEEFILASESVKQHEAMIKLFYKTFNAIKKEEDRKISKKIGIIIEETELFNKLNAKVENEALLLYYLCNLEAYKSINYEKFPLQNIMQQISFFEMTPLIAQIFIKLFCKHYQTFYIDPNYYANLLANHAELLYNVAAKSIESCKLDDEEEGENFIHENFITNLCKTLYNSKNTLVENILHNLLTHGSSSFLNLIEMLRSVINQDSYDLVPIIRKLNSGYFKSICLSIEVKQALKIILKLENLKFCSSIDDSLPLIIENKNTDYFWLVYKLCKYKKLQISIEPLKSSLFNLQEERNNSISLPIIQEPFFRKLALKTASLNPDFCKALIEHEYKSFLQENFTKLAKSQTYVERYNLNEFKGLKNFGSTCYINSTFQLLYGDLTIRKCIQASQTEEQPSKALAYIFNKLAFSCMKNIKTKTFLKEFKNYDGEEVNPCLQMDAEEFFTNLMYQIENQETGKIIKYISTSHKQITKCNVCSQSSSNFTTNFITPIEIEGMSDINEAIEGFKQKEILYGDNQFYCHYCSKKVDAEKSIELDKLPEFLLLSLKRFKYDVASQQMKKIMSKCVLLDQMTISTNIYQLSGIILHIGNDFGGHYVTVSKRGDKWYLFNDEIINELTNFNPEDLSSTDNPTLSNPLATPYIILYKATNFTKSKVYNKFDSACIEKIKQKNTQVINFNLYYNTDFRCFFTKLIENNIAHALDVYISGYVYFMPPNEIFMNKIYIRFLELLTNDKAIRQEAMEFISKKSKEIVKILTGRFNDVHKILITSIIEKSFDPETYFNANNFISSLLTLFCYNHMQFNMTFIIKLIIRYLENYPHNNINLEQKIIEYFYSQKININTIYVLDIGDLRGTNFKEFFKYILKNYEQAQGILNMFSLEYFNYYCSNFPALINMKKFGRIMGKFHTKDRESLFKYIDSLKNVHIIYWESLVIDILKSIEDPNLFYSDEIISYAIASIEHMKSSNFIEKIINIIKSQKDVAMIQRQNFIKQIESAVNKLSSNQIASGPPDLSILYKKCYEGIEILKKNAKENSSKESCEAERTYKGGFVILKHERLALLSYGNETKLIFLD